MHKSCAGLPKHAFEFYSDPTHSTPFQCPHCKLQACNCSEDPNPIDSIPDHKFQIQIVIYECAKGTPRHVRIGTDTNSVTKTIQSICPELTGQSICDCTRLGKYSNDRHRPVLAKLIRSCDVSNILANRRKLSNLRGISIKPLMTSKERRTESTLLRQRRALIDSGVRKDSIKILH